MVFKRQERFFFLIFISLSQFLFAARRSVVASCRIFPCGTWTLYFRHTNSSCSMADGMLVPQPGIEPTSPALQGGFLTAAHQQSPGQESF